MIAIIVLMLGLKMLEKLEDYGIGETPIYKLASCNIYLKMEKFNKNRSIKDRTAYFLIENLLQNEKINKDSTIIESTSGNLGVSLDYFSKIIGIKFQAIIDKTIAQSKLEEFKAKDINYIFAPLKEYSNYRTARIELAKELAKNKNYIWLNQYDNLANVKAHYQTTAPEIWKQMEGKIDIVVVAMGTCGTVTGVAKFFKEKNSNIQIYGVEPIGSTIFGGVESRYINVGIGLKGENRIISKYKSLIDLNFKVSDKEAIDITKKYNNIGFGISTGYSLVIALKIAKQYPNKNIIVIAPDGIEKYKDILNK